MNEEKGETGEIDQNTNKYFIVSIPIVEEAAFISCLAAFYSKIEEVKSAVNTASVLVHLYDNKEVIRTELDMKSSHGAWKEISNLPIDLYKILANLKYGKISNRGY